MRQPIRVPATDDSDVADELAELARRLRDRVLAGHYAIPLLPESVHTLLALAVDPSSSTQTLEQAIALEPLLAAKVVGYANSALYAARGTVTSLHQAAIRLGSHTLRELISRSIAEAHIYVGRPRGRMVQLQRHAVVVAHLSRFACALVDADDERAFLCGLLHDMGHAIVLSMLTQDCAAARLDFDQRSLLSELLHPIVGERVALAWGLPRCVADVCRFHHCYLGDTSPRTPASPSLTVIVAAADHLAAHLGAGDRPHHGDIETDPVWSQLAFSDEHLASMRDYGERMIVAVH